MCSSSTTLLLTIILTLILTSCGSGDTSSSHSQQVLSSSVVHFALPANTDQVVLARYNPCRCGGVIDVTADVEVLNLPEEILLTITLETLNKIGINDFKSTDFGDFAELKLSWSQRSSLGGEIHDHLQRLKREFIWERVVLSSSSIDQKERDPLLERWAQEPHVYFLLWLDTHELSSLPNKHQLRSVSVRSMIGAQDDEALKVEKNTFTLQ